jgi:hypothetical protein
MDIENVENYWLFPNNRKEAGFDCIFIASKKEVWFIQLTVAVRHNANEAALEKAKTVFQEKFSTSTVFRFVFVTPADIQFTIPDEVRKQLESQNINYLTCHSKAYWEL